MRLWSRREQGPSCGAPPLVPAIRTNAKDEYDEDKCSHSDGDDNASGEHVKGEAANKLDVQTDSGCSGWSDE